MKAVAASSIGQYEKSVHALAEYDRAIELGLGACLRELNGSPEIEKEAKPGQPEKIGVIIFGSDQGLVGQFNEIIADFAIKTLLTLSGTPQVWVVGERVHDRLIDAGLTVIKLFNVPVSIKSITSLVDRIQIASENHRVADRYSRVLVFHNRPKPGALYDPVAQCLLPLDSGWRKRFSKIPWPTKLLPEVTELGATTLRSLIREYLFISLFRACAESLVSENACRLSAMRRAEKNIGDSLLDLNRSFHRLRQSGIDEDLFDVVFGFEALMSNFHSTHKFQGHKTGIDR